MKKASTIVLFSFLVFAAIFCAFTISPEVTRDSTDALLRHEGTKIEHYSVNDSGMTYGVPIEGLEDPDLIPAVGVHGREGYVRSADLVSLPDNPTEAASSTHEEVNLGPKRVLLFEQDGVTVIGEFEVSSSDNGL